VETETSFARADFLKPRMDGPAEIDPYLAPLLWFEAPHGAPLGSARVNGQGELEIDVSRPTMYYARRWVRFDGRERLQLSFVWFRDTRPPVAQGVRLTFDGDGFPLITEVLTDSSGRRVVYVASELEDAAARDFGAPLAGRNHAIEAAAGGELEIALAGYFTAAPAPSGPYVYQARDSTDIATIHCRCSATQTDETREMIEYELVPFAALEGVWPPKGEPAFAAPDAPARTLRLPSSF
jgi:hypothetical protein